MSVANPRSCKTPSSYMAFTANVRPWILHLAQFYNAFSNCIKYKIIQDWKFDNYYWWWSGWKIMVEKQRKASFRGQGKTKCIKQASIVRFFVFVFQCLLLQQWVTRQESFYHLFWQTMAKVKGPKFLILFFDLSSLSLSLDCSLHL